MAYRSSSGDTAAGTTLSPARPTGAVAGDVLVAHAYAFRSTGATPGTITFPADWTVTARATNTRYRSAVAWKRATASEPASYTITSTSATQMGVTMAAFSGRLGAGTPATIGNQAFTQNTDQLAFGGMSTTAGDDVFLGGWYYSTSTLTLAVPTNYTGLTTRTTASNLERGFYREAAVGGAFSTFTTTMGSTSQNKHGFVVLLARQAQPVVSSLSVDNGPLGGGTMTVVTGAGFYGATGVSFGATPATSFTIDSDTQITAVSPAGTGQVDLTVTGPGGTSSTSSADLFDYTAAQVWPVTGAAYLLKPMVSDPVTGEAFLIAHPMPTITGSAALLGVKTFPLTGSAALAKPTIDESVTGSAYLVAHSDRTDDVTGSAALLAELDSSVTGSAYLGAPVTESIAHIAITTPAGTNVQRVDDLDHFTYVYYGLPHSNDVTGSAVLLAQLTNDVTGSAELAAPTGGAVQIKVTTPSGDSADTAADDFTYVFELMGEVTGSAELTHYSLVTGDVHITVTTASGTSTETSADLFTYGVPDSREIEGSAVLSEAEAVAQATDIEGSAYLYSSVTSDVHITVTTAGGTSATSSADVFTYLLTGGTHITVTTPYGTSAETNADLFTYTHAFNSIVTGSAELAVLGTREDAVTGSAALTRAYRGTLSLLFHGVAAKARSATITGAAYLLKPLTGELTGSAQLSASPATAESSDLTGSAVLTASLTGTVTGSAELYATWGTATGSAYLADSPKGFATGSAFIVVQHMTHPAGAAGGGAKSLKHRTKKRPGSKHGPVDIL